jgi:leader peptidase (prepilin peptidase)/N-methyltransferase
MRLRGQDVTATTRLPLGSLLALAAWPVWLVIAVT